MRLDLIFKSLNGPIGNSDPILPLFPFNPISQNWLCNKKNKIKKNLEKKIETAEKKTRNTDSIYAGNANINVFLQKFLIKIDNKERLRMIEKLFKKTRKLNITEFTNEKINK